MPDERDVANDKRVLQQNEREGTTAEMEGKHPEHTPQPGQKTPQEPVDRDAIDESGNLINPKEKDENDGM
jgi:hypothetical protein